MSDTVLVLGSGSREHAIVWKLLQSSKISRLVVAPGNGGIKSIKDKKLDVVDLDLKNNDAIVTWCKTNKPSLVFVGPEDPLDRGIANELKKAGFLCFGPEKEAAQIECSKSFAKDFMKRHKVPTANYQTFTDPDKAKSYIKNASFKAHVVKASGLAAGKGVIVAKSDEEACEAVDLILKKKEFGSSGDTIVIEELLEGDEISVIAFTDGKTAISMPPAQDHKRAFEGDEGPNTGGMGAVCPYPIDKETSEFIDKEIIQRTINGLRAENIPFVGALYAGLMLTKDGPKVIEFNCRFGDPETQSVIPLLDSDLYEIFLASTRGTLNQVCPKWKRASCGVVLASGGYPGTIVKGKRIEGLEKLGSDLIVFHAGTELKEDGLYTSGGRVLTVVAVDDNLEEAIKKARNGASLVKFEKSFYRKDIGHRVLKRMNVKSLDYKSSGVDIDAGNEFVTRIKGFCKNTTRPGVVDQIGGFGALFDLKLSGYSDPMLVSGTDGVGTKLKIAIESKIFDTVGIDLVAMSVNDILVQGAEPLFFLDYYACSRLDVSSAAQVVKGIGLGCEQANCALIGGETAEMPGMYAEDDFDLAGFAVGAVEKNNLLPKMKQIKEGDVIIGLPSSGMHSNGFSLVRKLLEIKLIKYSDSAPFDRNKTFAQVLLTPTKIYVRSLMTAIKSGKIKALSHITGGGLLENIPRILPQDLAVELDASKWTVPDIFKWIKAEGNVANKEMLKTFNCGLGMVCIVEDKHSQSIIESIRSKGEEAILVGKVVKKGNEAVVVRNFLTTFDIQRETPKPKKRVGVLISGTGTNLQALIDHTQNVCSSAQIVVVISNRSAVEGLKRAERAGIATKVVTIKNFPKESFASDEKQREAYDQAVTKILEDFSVDIVCAAGFMRILSGQFINRWNGRLINIHPSLLPSFKGTHAYKQAIEARVKITGCTVHFISAEVDSGAIILQEPIFISKDDTEESLQEKGKVIENKTFPKALELLAQDKIELSQDGKKVLWH